MAQVITWLKPHLSPLYAWASVTARGTVGRLPETVILTLKYIALELEAKRYMVPVARPLKLADECFRTDAKCTDDAVVLGGWELSSGRWFVLELTRDDVPFLFKPEGGAQWASTSAELLASLVALSVFGWLEPNEKRSVLPIAIIGGTDNRANEALTLKRATTKWPLMLINMELSAALSRARLHLSLRWRPREENEWADAITNLDFSAFEPSKRIVVKYSDFSFQIIHSLWSTKMEFDRLKLEEKTRPKPKTGKKRFDKSPW